MLTGNIENIKAAWAIDDKSILSQLHANAEGSRCCIC